MYRTELEPLPLNTRSTQRFWMLVVAVVSFAYVQHGAAGDAATGTTTPAPPAAVRPAAPANEVWRPPIPATSSVYHGLPQRTVPTNTAPGCAWTPPVPATSSVYSADCLVPPSVPARNAP